MAPPSPPNESALDSPSTIGRRIEAIADMYFEYVAIPFIVLWVVSNVLLFDHYLPDESLFATPVAILVVSIFPPVFLTIGVTFLWDLADRLHREASEAGEAADGEDELAVFDG